VAFVAVIKDDLVTSRNVGFENTGDLVLLPITLT
jgi:hypothetical protein